MALKLCSNSLLITHPLQKWNLSIHHCFHLTMSHKMIDVYTYVKLLTYIAANAFLVVAPSNIMFTILLVTSACTFVQARWSGKFPSLSVFTTASWHRSVIFSTTLPIQAMIVTIIQYCTRIALLTCHLYKIYFFIPIKLMNLLHSAIFSC